MSEIVLGGPAVRQRMLEESLKDAGNRSLYLQGRVDAISDAVARIRATIIVDGETQEKLLEAVAQRVADVGKPTAV